MLSQPEDDKPAETVLYEAIKVFDSKTMKKHWKKFIKASTEGKLKEKTEQEKVSLHMGTQAQESLEGLSFEVKLKKKRKNKKIT